MRACRESPKYPEQLIRDVLEERIDLLKQKLDHIITLILLLSFLLLDLISPADVTLTKAVAR